jgi:site-specific DNA-methyltransferase (adenine-specific)
MMESSDSIQMALFGESMSMILDLPPQCVDLILTDPPYGTTANKWDTVIPYDIMWGCFTHVIKPGGAIVMSSAQPFTSALAMSNIKAFKYEWVWIKENATGFLNAKKRPMPIHENVLSFAWMVRRHIIRKDYCHAISLVKTV